MSPAQADGNGFIDVSIPDHDDDALKELLISLDGGKAPTSLPAGWDKASACQRLSEHLQLIDSEIARKLKGLNDLNSHLAGLQTQDVPPPQQGRVELVPQHSAPCCTSREQSSATPRVPNPVTPVQPNWCVRTASPSPAFHRIASTPATFRGRIYKVPGSASTGCFMVPVTNTASVPMIRTQSPIMTVRSGSIGASQGRVIAPAMPVQCHGAVAPVPGSPRVVLNAVGGANSPDSRTRCHSPAVATVPSPAPGHGGYGGHGLPQRQGSRPPRTNAPTQAVAPSWHPHAAPPASHVSSRFILVSPASPYMAEAAQSRMGRSATPRRVASRPRAGASPTRPMVHRLLTPRA